MWEIECGIRRDLAEVLREEKKLEGAPGSVRAESMKSAPAAGYILNNRANHHHQYPPNHIKRKECETDDKCCFVVEHPFDEDLASNPLPFNRPFLRFSTELVAYDHARHLIRYDVWRGRFFHYVRIFYVERVSPLRGLGIPILSLPSAYALG